MRHWLSILLTAILLGAALNLRAAAPPDYYTNATGKTGFPLRAALHARIRQHTVVPYASSNVFDTSDALRILDQDPTDTNNVLQIYSGLAAAASTFGTVSGWNREHLWPNSYGIDDREPAYADLFNLRACDATVNSTRGNKFFDFSDTNSASYRKPGSPEAPLTTTDADSWEPPDDQKGDIARSLFYMDVRYEGDVAGEPDLVLTQDLPRIQSTNAFMGRLGILLAWNQADPVDDAERLRNDRAFELYQHNRNPFVDHPEWADAVYRPSLRIARNGTDVALSWDVFFTNAVVQSASGDTSTWMTLSVTPSVTSGQWTVVLPVTNAAAVFRLGQR